MSIPHHGKEEIDSELAEKLAGLTEARDEIGEDLKQRFVDEVHGKAKQEYPKGQVYEDDEGVTAFAIAHDTDKHVLIVQFTKPMSWIGFDVESAITVRDRLSEFIEAEQRSST